MVMVYRRPSRKYERDTLWESRNRAFDFPHFSGDLSPTIQDATLLDVFIIATIQQNLGRNRYVGEFPDDRAFASTPDYRIYSNKRPTSS